MKILADNIPILKKRIDEKIDQVLLTYRKRNGGGMAIALLSGVLSEDKSGIGQIIIKDHECFKGEAISIFNEETQRYGIDIILERLEGDKLDKEKLKEHYSKFNLRYKQIV